MKAFFYRSIFIFLSVLIITGCGGSSDNDSVTAPSADTTPPVITLVGSTPVEILKSSIYTDAGATAMDDVDGDITENIVTVNPVNTNTVGTYIVTYNVSDAAGNAAHQLTRTVNVTAEQPSPNVLPVVDAGSDRTVQIGESITITGSGSDSDGMVTAYEWRKGTTVLATSASFSYTPDTVGTDILTLTVTDDDGATALDSMNVIVNEIPFVNHPPVANAGVDQNIHTTSYVPLDGSASNDIDGDTLTYKWEFINKPEGSSALLSDTTIVSPTFVADVEGTYVLRLTVNDGTVNSAADSVTIVATTSNAAPVANAGVDQNINTGSTVNLDGSESSDADGDLLTYEWSFDSKPLGSNASLSNTLIDNPTFVADVEGTYVLQLTVNDDTVDSATDSVTIVATTSNAAPVANAGVDQNINTGSTVNLDGSASSDADGDLLTYKWSFESKPLGSNASLSNTLIDNPTFVADVEGTYVLQLTVNDGTVNSAANSVTIVATTSNVGEGPIKIGWAEINITPPDTFLPIELRGQGYSRLTSTILDPLTATALAIESESGEQWILVSVDTCDLGPGGDWPSDHKGMLIPLRDSLQGILSDFDLNKLTLVATHTHTAPYLSYDPYFDFVKEKLKLVVQQAWNNRVLGGISFEKGSAAVGFCRIVKYTDGHHEMYGDTTRQDFDGILAPYDHTLELMYTFNSNGGLTGIMINIVSPAQLDENEWYISADFWHDVRQKLRQTYGNELFILPYSGAAGDMSPHNIEGIQATRDEIGEMIANSVRERYPFAMNTIKYQIKMGHAIRNVNLTTKSYYQGNHPLYSEPRPVYLAEIHAVRLDNAVWINNPFELYNAWGEAIKNASMATQTIIAQMSGLTRGGYLPTLEAVYGGAYGGRTENGWCDDIGGQQLLYNSVNIINGLFENNNTPP